MYGKEIMPPTTSTTAQCQPRDKRLKCFDAGDLRVNQHPGLQSVHVQWLRRHNQHARGLKKMNPHWSDEKIFQEARKMTIAEHQHITYAEYLPIVLGPKLMSYYDLNVRHKGYSHYDKTINPSSWNEFITSASRYGHSQIQGFFKLHYGPMHRYSNRSTGFSLRNGFFDPTFIHQGMIDQIVQGMVLHEAATLDPYVTEDIKNYLYKTKDKKHGSDLIAFNIHRGRDHGLPPYHAFVEFCFGIKMRGWGDIEKFIPYKHVQILKTLYADWRDIDLYAAGLAERKIPDGDVGPTFSCLVGIQFHHIKHGDRFFYSHGPSEHSFTPAQLENIRQTATLANFICRTLDYVETVTTYPFLMPSKYNRYVRCRDLPDMNHHLWHEKPGPRKPKANDGVKG